jgi:NTP pyrophosphatase (non-canonical NTP hydrolase)
MKHNIVISYVLLEEIAQALYDARTGSLEEISYSQFVETLFKEMDTASATLHHATTGLAGEGGEILDCSKKSWIYNKPLDVENLIEELGDLRFYYQACLNMLGLSDYEIQAMNRKKLLHRYPTGQYSDQHAQQRLDKQ